MKNYLKIDRSLFVLCESLIFQNLESGTDNIIQSFAQHDFIQTTYILWAYYCSSWYKHGIKFSLECINYGKKISLVWYVGLHFIFLSTYIATVLRGRASVVSISEMNLCSFSFLISSVLCVMFRLCSSDRHVPFTPKLYPQPWRWILFCICCRPWNWSRVSTQSRNTPEQRPEGQNSTKPLGCRSVTYIGVVAEANTIVPCKRLLDRHMDMEAYGFCAGRKELILAHIFSTDIVGHHLLLCSTTLCSKLG